MRFVLMLMAGSVVLILSMCQEQNSSEYYGTLESTPSGLVLVQSTHAFGWSRSDCFACHVPTNFHQDRPERPASLDIEASREIVAVEGLASCSDCHGTNGVTQP